MSPGQRVPVEFVLMSLLAIAATAVALWMDLAPWITGQPQDSAVWRFARTVLCALAAVAIVRQPLDRNSRWLLPLAMALAVVADYFLILGPDLVRGIAVFAMMQVALIVRHLLGIRRSALQLRSVRVSIACGVLVLGVGNGLLWPALSAKGLAVPVLIYSALLIFSVVAARVAGLVGALPRPQAAFALWGMVLFLLCDITVGIGAAVGHTAEGQLVRALTGLFYTPSLLLLVRSGTR